MGNVCELGPSVTWEEKKGNKQLIPTQVREEIF